MGAGNCCSYLVIQKVARQERGFLGMAGPWPWKCLLGTFAGAAPARHHLPTEVLRVESVEDLFKDVNKI